MRVDGADKKDRLKASEYIAKANGAFVDKKELKGAIDGKIEFGFCDSNVVDN
ncbi:hypothetical protein ACN6MT_03195 [Neobacillus niacini]|uniref:hypothetical protein n=1 Tax=Neobacillus niacini TaxID=86668 RepID=UPI003B01A5D6